MLPKPQYHYRPEKNWINDPNGLCHVDGWYHMFYQYNPNGPLWNDMHWGHARSRDMMRWETLPIAMAPALEKGEIHCFSGSCCVGHDGVPRVYYTSIGRREDGRDARNGAEQWTAVCSADMNELRQTDAHALRDPAIHGGTHVREWRDPHVIKWQDGYLMAVGGLIDGCGCVMAYTSPDGIDWTWRGVMHRSRIPDGIPFECPNIFVLGGKFGLLYSPYGPVEYVIGTLDEHFRLHAEHSGVLDPSGRRGFYAPQTFVDAHGRQILLGWMPEGDGDEAALARGWSGAMSLPRLMNLDGDGDLFCGVLPEALSIAEGWTQLTAEPGETVLTENGACSYVCVNGRITAPVMITIRYGAEKSVLTLMPDGMLTLDRNGCGANHADHSPIIRTVPVTNGEIGLFAATDHSTVECMVNGRWLSGRVYPETDEKTTITIACGDRLDIMLCDAMQTVNEQF